MWHGFLGEFRVTAALAIECAEGSIRACNVGGCMYDLFICRVYYSKVSIRSRCVGGCVYN